MSILRRIIVPDASYFVTVCVERRTAVPLDDASMAILVESFVTARDRYAFHLLGYVFMPDHWHVLVQPLGTATISDVIGHIKLTSTHRLNTTTGRRGRYWERRFYDHLLRQPREYAAVLNYMHHNPVAAHLVSTAGAWPWSSWHDYFGIGGPVGIDQAQLPDLKDRREALPELWKRGGTAWQVVTR